MSSWRRGERDWRGTSTQVGHITYCMACGQRVTPLGAVCQDRTIQQSDVLKEFLVAAQKVSR